MNQLNSVILEGNVVANAELTEPAKGFMVCKFTIGVNRFSKNSNGDVYEEVSFIDVEAYGKIAEICEKNSTKGRGIRIVGRIKQSRWKSADGKNYSRIYVIAEHVEYKPKFDKLDSTYESKEEKASAEMKVADTAKDDAEYSKTVSQEEVAVF